MSTDGGGWSVSLVQQGTNITLMNYITFISFITQVWLSLSHFLEDVELVDNTS